MSALQIFSVLVEKQKKLQNGGYPYNGRDNIRHGKCLCVCSKSSKFPIMTVCVFNVKAHERMDEQDER